MRLSMLLPLVLLTVVSPCRAGWGGPAATGATGNVGVVNATATAGFSGGPRGNVPVNAAPVSQGVRVAPTLGANPRGPVAVSGPAWGNAGARSAPITGNARPVGVVATPRPVMNPNVSPILRPPLPATNPGTSSSRLSAADANRNRPTNNSGVRFPQRPERPFAGYISYPDNSYRGGRRPGHYVPGETYVQQTQGLPCIYPYAAAPTYYLGGAFPYFYGGPIGTYGTALGVAPDAAPAPAANATAEAAPATAPAEEGEPTPPEPNKPARTPELAGANSLVEAVQAELLRRGYFTGHPDGIFRADTGDALRRFQVNHGLASTGLVNEATLFALGLN